MLNGVYVEKASDSGQDVIISDAGPLIHLDELDCIDLRNSRILSYDSGTPSVRVLTTGNTSD